jgi:putative hydroxymethylpyrimidine transporter CytX
MNTPVANPALTPIPADQRVFNTLAHASLWFSLGVGLLVIQVGSFLMPAMSLPAALVAIGIGSIVGAGLLAWVGKLGCDTGLSSAGLMHNVYGSAFAKLPVLLNIAQLIGWTCFELVIMREGTQAIAKQVAGVEVHLVVATLIWGGVLTLLMTGSMLTLVRKFVSRFGLPLVILSLAWLSWHFVGVAQTKGFEALWNRPGAGGMSTLQAIDLVIAMPISWLPLIADYSRYGRSGGGALRGTWLGYAVANAWCYVLGVLVISVSEPGINMVAALLLAQGGLLALGLILLDELDNAYGDVHSAAVTSQSLLPNWSLKQWGVLIAVACTGLAMVLPMHTLEPFMLMLSSVFIPLYGVILGRLGWRTPAKMEQSASVVWSAAAMWLLGVVIFHGMGKVAPQLGSALPTLLVTFVLAAATRRR